MFMVCLGMLNGMSGLICPMFCTVGRAAEPPKIVQKTYISQKDEDHSDGFGAAACCDGVSLLSGRDGGTVLYCLINVLSRL